jgi:hypothetical protein
MTRLTMLVLIVFVAGIAAFSNSDGELKPIQNAIKNSDRLIIYEGLPHPGWEGDAFRSELSRVNPIDIHNRKFYSPQIAPSETDRQQFNNLLASPGAVRPYEGPKACGSFHADWCFEWHVGSDVYQGLFCFNCSEIMFFGPMQDVYCDIGSYGAAKSIKAMLEKYRANRPKSGNYDALLAD